MTYRAFASTCSGMVGGRSSGWLGCCLALLACWLGSPRVQASDPLPEAFLQFSMMPDNPWLYEGLPLSVAVHGFDPAGLVEHVEVFVDGVLAGESYRCPPCLPGGPCVQCPAPPIGLSYGYSLILTNLTVGVHQLVAVGYSNSGLILTTPPLVVRIRSSGEIPVVSVVVTDGEAREQGDFKSRVARFLIRRSGGDMGKPLAVFYLFGGSATPWSDFQLVPQSGGGDPGNPGGVFPGTPLMVILPADQAETEVVIEALGDLELEGDEMVRMDLVEMNSVVVPGISGIYQMVANTSGEVLIRDGGDNKTAKGARPVAFIEALGDLATTEGRIVGVHVFPLLATESYSVELILPDTLKAATANEGGVVDLVAHRVRWGPFTDALHRRLELAVSTLWSNNLRGYVTMGSAVLDLEKRYERIRRPVPELFDVRRLSSGIFQLLVVDPEGSAGSVLDVESSVDLKTWRRVETAAQMEGFSWHWELETPGSGVKFYRAVRR